MGEVPGTMYRHSSSGWTDTEIFDAWFADHFLQYAPAARPLLLLLDGILHTTVQQLYRKQ